MKITFWVLAALFALFALVQYNDPDPVRWILLYGGVSAQFGLAALGKASRAVSWLLLAVSLAWAATLLPDFINWIKMGEPSIVSSMKAEEPWIELTREFLGLLVAAAGCGFLIWKTRG